MNILLSNDDGLDSMGVKALIQALQPYGRIYLATPNTQKSATSHGITIREVITAEEMRIDGTVRAWRIGGLPADCIKLALLELLEEPMDLVISGINEGSNLGTDTLYSGTVAAAVEGAFMGVPSLAFSLAQEKGPWDFGPAAQICARMVESIQKGLVHIPPFSILNVNIPPLPLEEILGFMATRLGVRRYENTFVLEKNNNGIAHYTLKGEPIPGDHGGLHQPRQFHGLLADMDAIAQGYVSVAPISVDRTDFRLLAQLSEEIEIF